MLFVVDLLLLCSHIAEGRSTLNVCDESKWRHSVRFPTSPSVGHPTPHPTYGAQLSPWCVRRKRRAPQLQIRSRNPCTRDDALRSGQVAEPTGRTRKTACDLRQEMYYVTALEALSNLSRMVFYGPQNVVPCVERRLLLYIKPIDTRKFKKCVFVGYE